MFSIQPSWVYSWIMSFKERHNIHTVNFSQMFKCTVPPPGANGHDSIREKHPWQPWQMVTTPLQFVTTEDTWRLHACKHWDLSLFHLIWKYTKKFYNRTAPLTQSVADEFNLIWVLHDVSEPAPTIPWMCVRTSCGPVKLRLVVQLRMNVPGINIQINMFPWAGNKILTWLHVQ